MTQYSSGNAGGKKGNSGTDGSSNPDRLKDEAKDAVNKVTQQVKQGASEAVSEAKEQASSALHEQQEAFAEKLDHVCEALHDSAQRLREEDIAPVAMLIDQASERVERMAQYLREQELSDMYDSAQKWARDNPAWFLGGCFVVGLIAARLFKSAAAGAVEEFDDESSFDGSEYGLRGGIESRFSGQGVGSQYGSGTFGRQGITEPSQGTGGGWEEP